jgi:hypothetical protein
MQIPSQILEQLKITYQIMGDSDDWMQFKKLILNSIRSELRSKFSRRDAKTKKQSLNEFEKHLIIEYYNLTGIKLKLRGKNG